MCDWFISFVWALTNFHIVQQCVRLLVLKPLKYCPNTHTHTHTLSWQFNQAGCVVATETNKWFFWTTAAAPPETENIYPNGTLGLIWTWAWLYVQHLWTRWFVCLSNCWYLILFAWLTERVCVCVCVWCNVVVVNVCLRILWQPTCCSVLFPLLLLSSFPPPPPKTPFNKARLNIFSFNRLP